MGRDLARDEGWVRVDPTGAVSPLARGERRERGPGPDRRDVLDRRRRSARPAREHPRLRGAR